jgi:hypothetical protein
MMSKKTDRGMANDIVDVVLSATKQWARTRKQEERAPASRSYRYMRMTHERGVQFKEAAWEIMPQAYAQASGDGSLPANARQIMYAARPHIQKATDKPLRDDYFTQTLLPDYLDEQPHLDWNVVYDARGHFTEPHGGRSFGIGTLEVRGYLTKLHDPEIVGADFARATVKTLGPSGSFGALLFVEKEGFDPLLRAARISERFDLAVMSTKGMSVTAARELAEEICSAYDVPLLTLRDFDKTGFVISGTLERDTRRYTFTKDFERIPLGLSLDDVNAMELAFEHQHHPKGSKDKMIANLRENGASAAEIAFMFADFDELRSTRRVELNAMTSPQFIAFVERKLVENKIKKIVPNIDLLKRTFREYAIGHAVEIKFKKSRKAITAEAQKSFKLPANLKQQVLDVLKKHDTLTWHQAVRSLIDASVLMKKTKQRNK